MKLASVSKKTPEEAYDILYLVLFELEGKSLVKIGVTSRPIEERVTEILTSMFKSYREFPYCRPKRFRRTPDAYGKEAILHEFFAEHNYVPDKKFGGCTEFFDIELEVVVQVYEDLLDGKDIHESGLQQGTDDM